MMMQLLTPQQLRAFAIAITDVTGLRQELDTHIVRGPGFLPGRTAVINSSGGIDAAMGASTDCVRVDGSTGPCGPLYTRVDRFKLSAEMLTFTLAQYPQGQVLVYRNGILMYPGEDYDLSQQTIRFRSASRPHISDLVQLVYVSY